MRREVQEYLDYRPELKFIIREQPYWYRKLSRNPNAIYELEETAKWFYGRTFGQKLDRWNQQLESISSILSMLGDFKQNIPK